MWCMHERKDCPLRMKKVIQSIHITDIIVNAGGKRTDPALVSLGIEKGAARLPLYLINT